MSSDLKSILDVAERQLCTGCGICEFLEPDRFEIDDAPALGRRPFLRANPASETGVALKSCPGASLTHDFDRNASYLKKELMAGWGPVIEVWEGYACDSSIRKSGSSGGAATALADFTLAKKGFSGVLHTNARKDVPYLNETVLSKTRDELISATGSRYAPASPCDGLELVMEEKQPITFIGKPCDVAAVSKAMKSNLELARKIGLTIAFFCAGTPSTKGTLELLKKAGVQDPSTVHSVRYRGNGWPGMWTVQYSTAAGEDESTEMTYAESWGFLQKYRQWRCYICPDHTGEFADISVGDPWYRDVEEGEPGKSLIVARTEKGRDFILEAEKSGFLNLEKRDTTLLPKSQPNLLGSRGNIWPRLIILRLFGAAVPKYVGFTFFRFWRDELTWTEKRQSIIGTIVRVFKKRLNKRIDIKRTAHLEDHQD